MMRMEDIKDQSFNVVIALAKIQTKEEFEENPPDGPQEDDFNESLDELVKKARQLVAEAKETLKTKE
jgi:hypothetical protein